MVGILLKMLFLEELKNVSLEARYQIRKLLSNKIDGLGIYVDRSGSYVSAVIIRNDDC